jgi:predicted outer membrane repeat protein
MTIQNCTFANNTSPADGSAIYASGPPFVYSILNIYNYNTHFAWSMAAPDSITSYADTFTGDVAAATVMSGLRFSSCPLVLINQSTLSNLTGLKGGGIYTEQTSTTIYTNMTIENTQLTGNIAVTGGGMYITGLHKINVSKSGFSKNKVYNRDSSTYGGKGGGIFYDCTSSSVCKLNISNETSLTNNYAEIAGGAVYFSNQPPVYDTTSAKKVGNNTAKYGSNGASYAARIFLLEKPDSNIWVPYVANYNATLSKASSGSSSNTTTTTSTNTTSTAGATSNSTAAAGSTNTTNSTSGKRRRMPENQEGFASGQIMYPPIVIGILDENGEVVADDSTSILTVSGAVNTTTISGTSQFVASNGYYILYPLTVITQPGTTAKLAFTTDAIPSVTRTDGTSFNPSLTTAVTARNCTYGENLNDNGACLPCSAGLLLTSLNSNGSGQCVKCPTSAYCEYREVVGPQPNYFRLNANITSFAQCYNNESCLGYTSVQPLYQVSTCKIAYNETFCYTGWCEKKYKGNLCSDCVSGYAYVSQETKLCTACTGNPTYYLLGAAYAILAIVTVLLTVKNTIEVMRKKIKYLNKLRGTPLDNNVKDEDADSKPESLHDNMKIHPEPIPDNDNESERKKDDKKPDDSHVIVHQEEEKKDDVEIVDAKKMEVDDGKKEEDEDVYEADISAIQMKILINFLQLTAIISSFPFNWPSQLSAYFKGSGEVNSGVTNAFTFDCLLRGGIFESWGLNSFFAKLLILAVSPFMISTGAIIIWFGYYLARYRSKFMEYKVNFLNNLVATIVISLFIIHPTIIQYSLSAFKCENLGDPDSPSWYFSGDLDEPCFSSKHLNAGIVVALPSLVFWGNKPSHHPANRWALGFGIPAITLLALFHYKHQLQDDSILYRFGFLYEGYRLKFFYWYASPTLPLTTHQGTRHHLSKGRHHHCLCLPRTQRPWFPGTPTIPPSLIPSPRRYPSCS